MQQRRSEISLPVIVDAWKDGRLVRRNSHLDLGNMPGDIAAFDAEYRRRLGQLPEQVFRDREIEGVDTIRVTSSRFLMASALISCPTGRLIGDAALGEVCLQIAGEHIAAAAGTSRLRPLPIREMRVGGPPLHYSGHVMIDNPRAADLLPKIQSLRGHLDIVVPVGRHAIPLCTDLTVYGQQERAALSGRLDMVENASLNQMDVTGFEIDGSFSLELRNVRGTPHLLRSNMSKLSLDSCWDLDIRVREGTIITHVSLLNSLGNRLDLSGARILDLSIFNSSIDGILLPPHAYGVRRIMIDNFHLTAGQGTAGRAGHRDLLASDLVTIRGETCGSMTLGGRHVVVSRSSIENMIISSGTETVDIGLSRIATLRVPDGVRHLMIDGEIGEIIAPPGVQIERRKRGGPAASRAGKAAGDEHPFAMSAKRQKRGQNR